MERKNVKASELEVGMRYAFAMELGPTNWFTVVQKSRKRIDILFGDGEEVLFFDHEWLPVIEIPLTSLEKELV